MGRVYGSCPSSHDSEPTNKGQNMQKRLRDLEYNGARQADSLAVYETGTVFLSKGEELPVEEEHLAAAVTGLWVSNPWQGEKKPVDSTS